MTIRRLALRLKTRWRDGTTHILMERHELLERLVPLIPTAPCPPGPLPRRAGTLRERVASEIKTVFARHYTKVVSLAEALQPESLAVYGKQATGEKYLINPNG